MAEATQTQLLFTIDSVLDDDISEDAIILQVAYRLLTQAPGSVMMARSEGAGMMELEGKPVSSVDLIRTRLVGALNHELITLNAVVGFEDIHIKTLDQDPTKKQILVYILRTDIPQEGFLQVEVVV